MVKFVCIVVKVFWPGYPREPTVEILKVRDVIARQTFEGSYLGCIRKHIAATRATQTGGTHVISRRARPGQGGLSGQPIIYRSHGTVAHVLLPIDRLVITAVERKFLRIHLFRPQLPRLLHASSLKERKMTSVWKTKVLPGLNKIFDKDGKKAAAAEFLKSFNKEEIDKEIEDKKTELEPKVVEIIEASPPEIKGLIKDKKTSKIKKNSVAVTKFLDDLAKIDFPGAKLVSDAVAKSGTTPLSPAIVFILDKVAPFVPAPKEEPKVEPEVAAAAPAEETTTREVAVEEEKKEEAEPSAAPAEAAAPARAAGPPGGLAYTSILGALVNHGCAGMRLWCQVPTTANEESFVAPTELGGRFKGIWRDGVNSRGNKIPAVGQPRSGRVRYPEDAEFLNKDIFDFECMKCIRGPIPELRITETVGDREPRCIYITPTRSLPLEQEFCGATFTMRGPS
ncbi:hypothetical protein TRIUR3_26766 [Triticum urartu]|uniref:Uncharacterized protein n=1 Tax=Triticum urartu TaxID=4572 RepID=M7ZP50_TRIUA|nr:hypothetical protein TRIUR3_26766 [Triticum urartu]